MEEIMRENSVALAGTTERLNGAREGHTRSVSLFPEEPLQVRRPARPTWRQWMHSLLLGGGIKRVGSRIFQRERAEKNAGKPKHKQKPPEWVEGDPENDRVALERILLDKDDRRFDLEWLDDFVSEYGDEARKAIVGFVCERYGFQMPIAIPDPVIDQQYRQQLVKRANDLVSVAQDLVAEIRQQAEPKR